MDSDSDDFDMGAHIMRRNMMMRRENKETKFTDYISRFLSNGSNNFNISDAPVKDELPEILKTLDNIESFIAMDCNIVNLKNLPQKAKRIVLNNNLIRNISSDDIPETVEILHIACNNIDKLDLSKSVNIKELLLSKNPLNSEVIFPPNVEKIVVDQTEIKDTSIFTNLKKLNLLSLKQTNINCIDNLPDTIKQLEISGNTIKIIKKLPLNIVKLSAIRCEIKEFEFKNFPESLLMIDVESNDLETIPILPNVMKFIDISNNRKLSKMENIPEVERFIHNDVPLLKFKDDTERHIPNRMNAVPSNLLSDNFRPSQISSFKIEHRHICHC